MQSFVDELKSMWDGNGLLHNGEPKPTFIEEVGLACAENVRSAAICRWMNQHQKKAVEWLENLGCHDVPKGVRFLREIPFDVTENSGRNKRSRIDIGVYNSLNEHPVAFIEMKWLAELSGGQLDRYRRGIDEKYPGHHVPLFALCPVKQVQDVLDIPRRYVHLRDYDSLLQSLKGRSEGLLSFEEDIAQTLARWRLLSGFVHHKILASESTTVEEIGELDSWLLGHGNPIACYSELLRRIIVADLADMVGEFAGYGLRRTYTAKGPRGDMQADVAGEKDFSFFHNPKAVEKDHGMLVCIRIRMPKDEFKELQVSLGSSYVPYRNMGEPDPGEWDFCEVARGIIGEKLRLASMNILTSSCQMRWKCSHTRRFKGSDSMTDVVDHGRRLTDVLRAVAEAM